MASYLIYNCGSQEPRVEIDGEFLLASCDSSRALHRAIGIRPIGIYDAALAIAGKPQLTIGFPILEPALAYVEKLAGQPVTAVILLATEAPQRPPAGDRDDPRHNDTKPLALLMQTWLQANDRPAAVHTISHAAPHHYGNAKTQIALLQPIPALAPGDRLFVCTSPGLAMVNAAMIQYALQTCSGETFAFQVEEPPPDVLVSGAWMAWHKEHSNSIDSVAEVDIASDYLRESIQKLIQQFSYKAALDVLQRLPETPRWQRATARDLLHVAVNQWDLPRHSSTNPQDFDPRPWFDRAAIALHKSEAAGSIGDRNEELCWLADLISFFHELIGAIALSDEAVLTAPRRTKPKEWEKTALKHPVYGRYLSELPPTKTDDAPLTSTLGICARDLKPHRNAYVHAFLPCELAAATIESARRSLWALLHEVAVIRLAGEPVSWQPPRSFGDFNQEIAAALEHRQ